MSDFRGVAHVSANVFSDSELRLPGNPSLIDNPEFNIRFEDKFLFRDEDRNYLADLCEGQRLFRTGFFDPNRHAILVFTTRNFAAPKGCDVVKSDVSSLFSKDRERSGTILQIEVGTGGYLLFGKGENRSLDSNATVLWIGEGDSFEFTKLVLATRCGENCDPTGYKTSEVFLTKHDYLDPKSFNQPKLYRDALQTKITEAFSDKEIDFLAVPVGYLRYRLKIPNWEWVDPFLRQDAAEAFKNGTLSTAPKIQMLINDAAVQEENYLAYLKYFFAPEITPVPHQCLLEEIQCLANMFTRTPTEVLWWTPVRH